MKTSTPLVLVLDNDGEELVDLYSFLDREGCLVATRSLLFEALKYASEHKPDIVIISGPISAPQCRSAVLKIQMVSPRSHLIVLRKDDSSALGDCASEHVTVFGRPARGRDGRAEIAGMVHQISRKMMPAPAASA
jgi:hypothetical protein